MRSIRLAMLLVLFVPAVASAQDRTRAAPTAKPNSPEGTAPKLLPDFDPGFDLNSNPNFDPNDLPLGDVARSLRKKNPPAQGVVDDDNLSAVMQQAESRHTSGSAFRFLMAGEGKGFRVSAPDATCSLAFTANTKALLSNQYAQMELPPDEVQKLEGPATIEGDALIVALNNRTDWHVSEVSVALTVVKKSEMEPQSGKDPDVTMIYRMRAAATPAVTTVFSAPLKLELAPDEEWHWAIVQARGYPPQSYSGRRQTMPEIGPEPGSPVSEQSLLNPTPPATAPAPQNTTAVSLSQNPQ